MNPIVNLNIVIEKELELERQGYRRTRRWLGDAGRDADSGWYQAKVSQVSEAGHDQNERSRVVETKPTLESHRSILNRFSLPQYNRRRPAKSET
jgi:hypothetical protein